MSGMRELEAAAARVARGLMRDDRRIVFAESCTGGLVSAALAGLPGISAHHCGSAVVYRVETKAEWLGISRELLASPGPVSREVAEAMARRVLQRTPEADLSASITGHLGPNAPPEEDGLLFIAVAERTGGAGVDSTTATAQRHHLAPEPAESRRSPRILRRQRQRTAAVLVLNAVHGWLERHEPRDRNAAPD